MRKVLKVCKSSLTLTPYVSGSSICCVRFCLCRSGNCLFPLRAMGVVQGQICVHSDDNLTHTLWQVRDGQSDSLHLMDTGGRRVTPVGFAS